MSRCAVVGAGAWGTALADLLARNGHDVALWAYEPDVVESINNRHENTRFLAGAALSPALRATGDFADALGGATLVCVATPAQHLRAILRRGASSLPARATVCVASKGIERDTLALMSDVVAEEAPGRRVVALSGPSFAAEVMARQPTAVVAASDDEFAAEMIQDSFSNATF
ncbi:MAG: NAD(P)-binding domain-containing protein, partial [Gemmatimonadota bacterium]|nr:NAD(P)-binding domain-containing protein [Gemmatimonadota bacterium]